jgi:ankyrin repeat protein
MENNFNSRDILWACRQGNIRLVKFLIKKGFDPLEKVKIDDNHYVIPIHLYGESNRNITESKKQSDLEKIKKIMIERDIVKEFQRISFTEELQKLFSAPLIA